MIHQRKGSCCQARLCIYPWLPSQEHFVSHLSSLMHNDQQSPLSCTTMLALDAPGQSCRWYCGKYCKVPKLGQKLGHV